MIERNGPLGTAESGAGLLLPGDFAVRGKRLSSDGGEIHDLRALDDSRMQRSAA